MQFDPAKNQANITKHGVSLERAPEMDIQAVLVDERHDYGEVRYRALGFIDGVAHCLVFTDRQGELRAISLRRAHQKEMKRYVSQTNG